MKPRQQQQRPSGGGPPPPRRSRPEADDRDDPFRAEKRMRRLEEAFEAGGGGSDSDSDAPSGDGAGAGKPELDFASDDDDDDDSDDDAPEEQQKQPRRRRPDLNEDDEEDEVANDDDGAPLEHRVSARRPQQPRLSDLPLEQRERLQRDGTGPAGQAARDRARKALEAQRSLKRPSRDAPREMSSKRPVSRHREVIQVSRESILGRDPRFPTAAEAPGGTGGAAAGGGGSGGGADPEAAARRRFSFLYDEAMPRERAELKAKLKREKNSARASELQQRLAQVEQRLRDEAARRRKQKAREQLKSGEKQAVAEGKRPYFPKKSEVRAAELVARYEELKKGGKLERYMEKRRRRNAAKDHRYLPSARRGEE